MSPRNFKLEFKALMRTAVMPLFKAQGFECRGQSFRRRHGDVFQYVTFEGSRSNDASSFSFAGNLSFSHATPAVMADFWCDDPTTWVAGERLGFLTHGLDHWYQLHEFSADDMIILMRATLTDTVLPSLEDVRSAEDAHALFAAMKARNRERGLRLPSPFVQATPE